MDRILEVTDRDLRLISYAFDASIEALAENIEEDGIEILNNIVRGMIRDLEEVRNRLILPHLKKDAK